MDRSDGSVVEGNLLVGGVGGYADDSEYLIDERGFGRDSGSGFPFGRLAGGRGLLGRDGSAVSSTGTLQESVVNSQLAWRSTHSSDDGGNIFFHLKLRVKVVVRCNVFIEAATFDRTSLPRCSVVLIREESVAVLVVVLLIVVRTAVVIASLATATETEMAAGALEISEFEHLTTSLLDGVVEENPYLIKVVVEHQSAENVNYGEAPGVGEDVLEPDLGPVPSASADASSSAKDSSVVVREEVHLDSDLVVGQIVGHGGGIGRW